MEDKKDMGSSGAEVYILFRCVLLHGCCELNTPYAEIKLASYYVQILLTLERNVGLEGWLSS